MVLGTVLSFKSRSNLSKAGHSSDSSEVDEILSKIRHGTLISLMGQVASIAARRTPYEFLGFAPLPLHVWSIYTEISSYIEADKLLKATHEAQRFAQSLEEEDSKQR